MEILTFGGLLLKALEQFQNEGPLVDIAAYETWEDGIFLYVVLNDLPEFLEETSDLRFKEQVVRILKEYRLDNKAAITYRFFSRESFLDRAFHKDPEVMAILESDDITILLGEDLLTMTRDRLTIFDGSNAIGSIEDMLGGLNAVADHLRMLHTELFRLFMNGVRLCYDLENPEVSANERLKHMLDTESVKHIIREYQGLDEDSRSRLIGLYFETPADSLIIEEKIESTLEFVESLIERTVEWVERNSATMDYRLLLSWIESLVRSANWFQNGEAMLNELYKLLLNLELHVDDRYREQTAALLQKISEYHHDQRTEYYI